MNKYFITEEVNLYKTKDASRKTGVLDVESEYLIEVDLPDGADKTYRTAISKVADESTGLAEYLGFVNYQDFMKAACERKDLNKSSQEEIDTAITDEVSVKSEEQSIEKVNFSNEEDPIPEYRTVHIKRGITFDYDNKPTGHLPNEYLFLKEENNITYVQNKASCQTFRFSNNVIE